jgi:hypothetical protein
MEPNLLHKSIRNITRRPLLIQPRTRPKVRRNLKNIMERRRLRSIIKRTPWPRRTKRKLKNQRRRRKNKSQLIPWPMFKRKRNQSQSKKRLPNPRLKSLSPWPRKK